MTEGIVLVDAHVHVHAVADPRILLDSAAANLASAARRIGSRYWQGALLLAETSQARWFDSVPPDGARIGRWLLSKSLEDPLALRAECADTSLLIVAGRQIVTREGVEVLALGTNEYIADGARLADTLRQCRVDASLTVLPWGVGKWIGPRGSLVAAAFDDPALSIHGGDNGGRPWFWPRPLQWRRSVTRGVALLNGSDPLPLAGDERRVGSFGSWIPGTLSPTRTGFDLMEKLKAAPASRVRAFGALQGAGRFIRNQVGLRRSGNARERRAAVEPSRGAESPDVETSTADYARRFAGPGGRYLLDVQSRSVRLALHDLPAGRVLDVGGGHGQLVDLLRGMGWDVTVHGSTEECGRNLRELHGKDVSFIEGDIFQLPVADGSFDLVIAVRLVSHVEDWPRLLCEMCRVSRGAVVIDYPAKGALNALTPLLFGLKKSLEGNTRTYSSFSAAELRRVFSQCGFGRARRVKQFLMPMVVHRVGKGAAPLRAMESAFRLVGLTSLFGSPVILRVDRQ